MNSVGVDVGAALSVLAIIGYIVKVSSAVTRMQVLLEMLGKIVDKHESDIDSLKEREGRRAVRNQGGRGRFSGGE